VVKAAFMTACGPDAEAEGKSNNSAWVFERIPWLLKWHEDVTTQAVIQFRGGGKVKRKVQKELEPVVNIVRFPRPILFHRLTRFYRRNGY
jgi:hypothetical protein